jgi:hypothetical protein
MAIGHHFVSLQSSGFEDNEIYAFTGVDDLKDPSRSSRVIVEGCVELTVSIETNCQSMCETDRHLL